MMRNNNKEDSNNQDYLSLQEATKFCSYSQEYLSLRARQGKLKSVKFGRDWVTTREWLEDYEGRMEEYNNSINNKPVVAEKTAIEKKQIIKYSPPENLPIFEYPKFKISLGGLRPGLVASLVLVLVVASGVFGKESLIRTYNDFSPYIEKINRVGELFIEDATQSLAGVYRGIARFSDDFYLAAVNYRDTAEFTSDVFSEYSQWFRNQILK